MLDKYVGFESKICRPIYAIPKSKLHTWIRIVYYHVYLKQSVYNFVKWVVKCTQPRPQYQDEFTYFKWEVTFIYLLGKFRKNVISFTLCMVSGTRLHTRLVKQNPLIPRLALWRLYNLKYLVMRNVYISRATVSYNN